MLVEESFGADDVVRIYQRQRIEDLAGALAAEECAKRIESEGTDKRSCGAPEDRAKQGEARNRASREAGKWQDDLGR